MDPSEKFWLEFISTSKPETIAKQLLQDRDRLSHGQPPSTIVLYLPKVSSREAVQIGAFLAPPATDLHGSIARLLYKTIRSQLRRSFDDLGRGPAKAKDEYFLATELDVPGQRKPKAENVAKARLDKPDPKDVDTAVRVLEFLKQERTESAQAVDGILTSIQECFQNPVNVKSEQPAKSTDTASEEPTQGRAWDSHVRTYNRERLRLRQRACYICQLALINPHPVYKYMCRPCGAFNLAGTRLSLPGSLRLDGRTALVTGARVNLGYHVALRLLRCGAKVVATTRYPHDAAVRYAAEADFGEWQERLKVVGADLRTARDAFTLVQATRLAVGEWRVETLDILVNNAAQTLTDSVKKEERAVYLEQAQSEAAQATGVVYRSASLPVYQPRIRGGIAPLALYGVPEDKPGLNAEPARTLLLPDGVKDDGRTELEPYFKSSWVQTLSEIPYEDVVSAHAVNTFVPLILCRELLPLMGRPTDTTKNKPPSNKPLGYIINVSSREGLFETTADHAAKKGQHVHTNMTKAALNMLTQTEAASAWAARRVAMNSVDPGYMSAAPEMDTLFGGERPIGWEDGAGRVLWPVAIGEVEGDAVWGRFLKHYGAVDMDSRLNKG